MTSPPLRIGEIARELHERGDASLEADLPKSVAIDLAGNSGVQVDGDKLRFSSQESLNCIVAAEIQHELGAVGMSDAKRLFGAANALWRQEIGHTDTASGRLLAAAQADGTDVLQLAADAVADGMRVFDVLQVIERMLPHCDTLPLPSLIALNDAQYDLTRGDMAAGMFFGRLQKWLASRAATAQELLSALLAEPRESRGSLISATWMGWFESAPEEAAQSLINAASLRELPLPVVTTWIAGRMLLQDSLSTQIAQKLDTVVLNRLASGVPAERNAALDAATSLLHMRRGFDSELERLAAMHDQDALGYIAIALSRDNAVLHSTDLFFEWLDPCKHLSVTYREAIRQLDFALSRLLEATSDQEAALTFLTDWIEAQPIEVLNKEQFAELFNMCSGKILNTPSLLSRVVTRWLLADSMAPGVAVTGLLSRIRNEKTLNLSFDTQLLGSVPDTDLTYLARRLLGYVHDSEQLLSLALSLLSAPQIQPRVLPIIHSLLRDEIGYDYPETTIQKLIEAEKGAEPTIQKLLTEIRKSIEAYVAHLKALSRLKELAPPSSAHRAFLKARNKQNARLWTEARSKSIFQQIVTNVYLKGGDRSFQYLPEYQTYTEPTQMKSMSVSFEMPRRERLDPVGNAIRLFGYRSAKRGDS